MSTPESPKRARGRPPVAAGEPSEKLQVTVPASTYAAASERATRERTTLQAWVRKALEKQLDDDAE